MDFLRMKKRIIIGGITLLVLILGGFILFGSNKEGGGASDISENYSIDDKTLIHKDFQVVIQADWQELEVPPSTFVYLPPNTNQNDVEAEIISISISHLGENSNSLAELIQIGIDNTRKIMPDFELTENIDVTRGELIGRELKFSGTQEGVKRNFVQIGGIKYNKLYAVTYSCPADNCNYYDFFDNFSETIELVE